VEPGATRIFGFSETEAVGRSLDLIIPENLRERHWQGYRATMHTGQSRYGDGQILSVAAVRKDGTRVSVEFTIVPFTDSAGRMIGIAPSCWVTTLGRNVDPNLAVKSALWLRLGPEVAPDTKP
jgi:PAS domain S-box-containing protein